MNSVIKEHGESQRRKWKVANENEALCSICEETGGILIRCAHEKCSAHFHLDCALNQGGISLMDNGLLICECDVHYKEIIFCSCKQKYDSNKATDENDVLKEEQSIKQENKIVNKVIVEKPDRDLQQLKKDIKERKKKSIKSNCLG